MAGHHRVALAGHQHLEAAHVGLVDVVTLLVGDLLRLVVGALAQPDPAALVGERPAVLLGAVEVGLQHGSRLREVLAQLAQRRQRAVGGGVVLGVQGHRGPRVARRTTDPAGVLGGQLGTDLRERLPDRGQLHADLGVASEPGVAEPLEQVEVRHHGGLRVRLVEGVLAQEVERDVQPVVDQHLGRRHGVVGVLTGHVAVDHRPADRHPGDDVLDPVAPGQQQECLSQHEFLQEKVTSGHATGALSAPEIGGAALGRWAVNGGGGASALPGSPHPQRRQVTASGGAASAPRVREPRRRTRR